jgi:antitoxin component of MazEF toxin-antitoxin module
MLRKVFKAGNSSVISIPKDVLDYLGLAEGADVNVHLDRDHRQIVITPAVLPLATAGVDETFARQVAEFIEHYHVALEALARE